MKSTPLFLYSFTLFSIVLLTIFINKPDSSRELTVFMISSISSFEIFNIVRFAKSQGQIADPKTFFWIALSVANTDALNPIKDGVGG